MSRAVLGWGLVKVLKIMLGVALVPVLLMGACAGRAWLHDEEAKRFCLSMIPKMEEVRTQRGGCIRASQTRRGGRVRRCRCSSILSGFT